ncbi:MAG: hypothetical protein IJV68_02280 [Clostridia bacterium]|nr:hypothetical protein [Clostridia bacterium]
MQEKEISLKDMLFSALRKWRKIVAFAIICAILMGAFTAVSRVIDMNDPEKVELWQTEYEIAHGSYWAKINDIDRQINENEILASQAELAIVRLDIKKADYAANLQNIMANIEYYNALIVDCEANIEELKLEKQKLEYYLEYRREQNKNSLLMSIDPYDVNVYEAYIRVDSGYEILPGNTYQNQDPTPELIQTYCLLVNNTEFYDKMITELDLGTEVRYLTEVVSVGAYGANSIRVRVISDDGAWAKKVGEYMVKAIMDNHSNLIASIADHDLVEYNSNSYSVVDLDTYSRQVAFKQEEMNYEAAIRDVDMSILRVEENIRSINTDIRYSNQEIEEIEIAITELPLEEKTLRDEVNGYYDANFELKTERLELAKKPEPVYHGYTTMSVITGFVKYAIIGGVVGCVLAAIYFAVIGVMGGKVISSKQACDVLDAKLLGYWPKTAKKRLAFVDRWIGRLSGTEKKNVTAEVATSLVLSNVSVACGSDTKTILCCGGAAKETIDAVAAAIAEQLPNVKVISGTTIDVDPEVVHGAAQCDGVVLVEQIDKSGLNAVINIKEQLKRNEKDLLGIIMC